MASSNALNELSTQKSFSIVQTENLNQQPMPEKGEEFIIQDEDPINDTIEIVIEKSNIDRLNFDDSSNQKFSNSGLAKFRNLKQIKVVGKQLKNTKMKILEIKRKVVANKYFMIVMILIAVGLGIGLGFGLRPTEMSDQTKVYFGFPGELFLRVLRFITLPLYFCKLVTGIITLKRLKRKKMATQAVIFYSFSLSVSIMIGFLMVLTIKPGSRDRNINIKYKSPLTNDLLTTSDTILDIFRNIVPNNLFQMLFETYQTKLEPIYTNVTSFVNNTNSSASNITNVNFGGYKATPGFSRNSPNLLGLLGFSLVLGYIIGEMGNKGDMLYELIDRIGHCFTLFIELIIWMSPLGVFSLLCGTILQLENPESVFQFLAYYVVSCLVGFFIQGVIILPLIHLIFTKSFTILKLLKNVLEALFFAFASASSYATLPYTLKCLGEEGQNIPRAMQSILFIGTAVHYCASPIFQIIASIFIAQLNNIELTTADYFFITFLTFIAALTVTGVPFGSLVTIVLILKGIGIDSSQLGLVYTVDWLIDRFRSPLNVWANCIATDLIYQLNKKCFEDYKNN